MYSAVLAGDRVEHDEGNERLQALQAAARGRVGEHGVERAGLGGHGTWVIKGKQREGRGCCAPVLPLRLWTAARS